MLKQRRSKKFQDLIKRVLIIAQAWGDRTDYCPIQIQSIVSLLLSFTVKSLRLVFCCRALDIEYAVMAMFFLIYDFFNWFVLVDTW